MNIIRKRGFEVVKDEMRKNPGVEIQLPKRGSKRAVAYDVFSPVDAVINPGESVMIWSDVKAYHQDGESVDLNVRSSMGKHRIMLANTQGWVEPDYYNNPDNDGNLGFNLYNFGTKPYVIKVGDRIGQARFIPFLEADNGQSDEERKGGFGSSGK